MKDRYQKRMKNILVAMLICAASVLVAGAMFHAAAGATTRAQAVATVRAILNRNTSSCHINRVQSVSAVRSSAVWKVTAKLVMSGSGRSLNETAAWNVRVSDGKAVAADQLASEIENGCPY